MKGVISFFQAASITGILSQELYGVVGFGGIEGGGRGLFNIFKLTPDSLFSTNIFPAISWQVHAGTNTSGFNDVKAAIFFHNTACMTFGHSKINELNHDTYLFLTNRLCPASRA